VEKTLDFKDNFKSFFYILKSFKGFIEVFKKFLPRDAMHPRY